ncbi:MAG: lipoprotein-releasing ABC transporter permease subunit [Sutterella sp.]|nr:lipoprotein-releasing ABC transporter permease subunit [Sutterella sp.]
MKIPFEWTIGLTYTRAGRRGRRKDRFMSFISAMSVTSIALGVAALIIVLSVMNGFQKEVRDRMLSVVPHMELRAIGGTQPDWDKLASALTQNAQIVASAPFVQGQGLLTAGRSVRGAMVKGIDPAAEPKVSEIATHLMGIPNLAVLEPGEFRVVLGKDLAYLLGVRIGDKVAMMVPEGNVTPAGVVPRMRQFTVVGLMNSGHYEYDSSMALIHIRDAQALYRTNGPQGLRLKLAHMDDAPEVAEQLNQQLPEGLIASDWSQQNRTWFAAVQVEKRMMGIILFLIVLVGAFGLVSSLVMTVKEKQADIAILRTLGATQGAIMRIFVLQGTIVGLIGVTVGVVSGLVIAENVGSIVSFIEWVFGVKFLPKEVYFISSMPSDPRMSDVIPIALFSFILSVIATLYPSWRAARTEPAEALRYE